MKCVGDALLYSNGEDDNDDDGDGDMCRDVQCVRDCQSSRSRQITLNTYPWYPSVVVVVVVDVVVVVVVVFPVSPVFLILALVVLVVVLVFAIPPCMYPFYSHYDLVHCYFGELVEGAIITYQSLC